VTGTGGAAATDPDALQAFGIPAAAVEAAEEEAFEVLPDCVASVRAFYAMGTQWARAGMDAARVGLRYEALPVILKLHRVPAADRHQVFEDIRIMENAVLEELRK
jgi:hypothetical protein